MILNCLHGSCMHAFLCMPSMYAIHACHPCMHATCMHVCRYRAVQETYLAVMETHDVDALVRRHAVGQWLDRWHDASTSFSSFWNALVILGVYTFLSSGKQNQEEICSLGRAKVLLEFSAKFAEAKDEVPESKWLEANLRKGRTGKKV